jgi:hypothetical protein
MYCQVRAHQWPTLESITSPHQPISTSGYLAALRQWRTPDQHASPLAGLAVYQSVRLPPDSARRARRSITC